MNFLNKKKKKKKYLKNFLKKKNQKKKFLTKSLIDGCSHHVTSEKSHQNDGETDKCSIDEKT